MHVNLCTCALASLECATVYICIGIVGVCQSRSRREERNRAPEEVVCEESRISACDPTRRIGSVQSARGGPRSPFCVWTCVHLHWKRVDEVSRGITGGCQSVDLVEKNGTMPRKKWHAKDPESPWHTTGRRSTRLVGEAHDGEARHTRGTQRGGVAPNGEARHTASMVTLAQRRGTRRGDMAPDGHGTRWGDVAHNREAWHPTGRRGTPAGLTLRSETSPHSCAAPIPRPRPRFARGGAESAPAHSPGVGSR